MTIYFWRLQPCLFFESSNIDATVVYDGWSKLVDKHEREHFNAEHDVFLSLHVVEGIKKTAISQAKSSIASEHTKNICDSTYAAPLEIEKEREKEQRGGGRKERRDSEQGKSTRPKVPTRHSFRLTAYLIKTTLSRPACAENDAVHGPCNRQTKRERVAVERE